MNEMLSSLAGPRPVLKSKLGCAFHLLVLSSFSRPDGHPE